MAGGNNSAQTFSRDICPNRNMIARLDFFFSATVDHFNPYNTNTLPKFFSDDHILIYLLNKLKNITYYGTTKNE